MKLTKIKLQTNLILWPHFDSNFDSKVNLKVISKIMFKVWDQVDQQAIRQIISKVNSQVFSNVDPKQFATSLLFSRSLMEGMFKNEIINFK